MIAKGLAVLAVALATVSGIAQDQKSPSLLTVTGNAQVLATPDEASVRLGILQQGNNASEAQNKANAVMQRILDSVTKLGIDRKDIQTSTLQLMPLYAEPRPGQMATIKGYQAQNTISVRLTDFTLIGKVVDAGLDAGANEVQGVHFGLRNDKDARNQAMRNAAAEARAKAEVLADALGLRLVSVQHVSESGGYVQPMYDRGFGGAMAAEGKVGTPVEAGQINVSGSVTISYVIAPK